MNHSAEKGSQKEGEGKWSKEGEGGCRVKAPLKLTPRAAAHLASYFWPPRFSLAYVGPEHMCGCFLRFIIDTVFANNSYSIYVRDSGVFMRKILSYFTMRNVGVDPWNFETLRTFFSE